MGVGGGEVSGLKRGQMESKQVRELLERSQLRVGESPSEAWRLKIFTKSRCVHASGLCERSHQMDGVLLTVWLNC